MTTTPTHTGDIMTTTQFPTQMPSHFGMFTTEGNTIVAHKVREALTIQGQFLDAGSAAITTSRIQKQVGASTPTAEAEDTMVGDLIFSVLTGQTHEFLGLDTVAS